MLLARLHSSLILVLPGNINLLFIQFISSTNTIMVINTTDNILVTLHNRIHSLFVFQ
jgi:hypothetical protein